MCGALCRCGGAGGIAKTCHCIAAGGSAVNDIIGVIHAHIGNRTCTLILGAFVGLFLNALSGITQSSGLIAAGIGTILKHGVSVETENGNIAIAVILGAFFLTRCGIAVTSGRIASGISTILRFFFAVHAENGNIPITSFLTTCILWLMSLRGC